MNKIIILPEDVINKISAGEVIERPASVVKELIENSIDASSTSIEVTLLNGGKKEISVVDNGCGMTKEDAKAALLRYATSKIKSAEDLQHITTLGFRGEALPSICAVSLLELKTRREQDILGTYIRQEAGKIKEIKEIGLPSGTQVIVKNIFYNTPARLKYLKSVNYELYLISQLINIYSICYQEISFKLIHNKKVVYNTQSNDIKTRILNIYGKDVATNLIEINEQRDNLSIKGFISKPNITRSNTTYQHFFVNNRFIKNKLLNKIVDEAYRGIIPKEKHPIVFLFIQLDPKDIDVNVHPTKREINFINKNVVFDTLKEVIRKKLIEVQFPHEIKKVDTENKKREKELTMEIEKKPSHPPLLQPQAEHPLTLPIMKPEYEILAQIDNTYIIIKQNNEILIIDQHALHERIIYEKLLKQKSNVIKQHLLIPLNLELSKDKVNLVLDNLSLFNSIGFELDQFDDTTFLIRTAPAIFKRTIKEEVVLDLVDDIIEELPSKKEEIVEKILGLIACKLAIKKGERLSDQEIRALINDMDIVNEDKGKYVFACCHGRPSIYKITKEELDKYFKRR